MASKKDQGWNKIIGLIVILLIISWLLPKPADWSITYKKGDKIPYGAFILKNELKQLFSNGDIQVSNEPIYNTIKSLDSTQYHNYFILAQRPDFTELDLEKCFHFLNRGNNIFLAVDEIPQVLLDTFDIETRGSFWQILKKEALEDQFWEFTANNLASYADSIPTKKYGSTNFVYLPEEIDVLAQLNGDNVFIEIPVGKGKLFLHSHPLMFTNYFLLARNSSELASVCLSHLPNQTTIYDNYYQNQAQKIGMSSLQEVFNRPALRWAYTLFLISIFLFMFFYGKRTQRIIPIINPHKNESVGFAKTVGDLLFQNSNNKSIVDKKIIYFKQHIASKYNMHESNLSNIEPSLLASKSGHELGFIQELIQKMETYHQKSVIPHVQLMEFTKALNKFYYRN